MRSATATPSLHGPRFLAVLILTLVIGFLSAGCGPESHGPVVVALSGNPSTLDPHVTTETLTFQVTKSLYDTLVEPDTSGNLIPSLAESWTVSNDNLTITFNLRRDVFFHDGSPFDGADVKASLDRIRDPATGSPSAKEFVVIDKIDTPDSHTVVVQLKAPDAPLLNTLASGWSAILPSEKIASGFDFATQADGTGPFMLESWEKDSRINLKKNPAYWIPDRPLVEALRFQIIADRSLRIQGMISNQLDVMDLVLAEDIPTLQAEGNVRIAEDLSSLVLVIAINTSRGILGNKDFRAAIAQAIDKRKVLDLAYGGGTIVGTFNDAGNPYYVDYSNLYPYNPEAAKTLVAKSGYTSQQVLDLVVPQNFAPHVKAGQLYQSMLKEVGIEAKIRLVDWSTWINEVYGESKYDLTVIGHTGKLDPDGRFQGYGRGGMYTRWNNVKAAELIEHARETLSTERRGEMYREVQRYFAEDLPFVYIGTPKRIYAYNKRISGFVYTPNLDTYDLRDVHFVQ